MFPPVHGGMHNAWKSRRDGKRKREKKFARLDHMLGLPGTLASWEILILEVTNRREMWRLSILGKMIGYLLHWYQQASPLATRLPGTTSPALTGSDQNKLSVPNIPLETEKYLTFPSSATTTGSTPWVMTVIRLCVPDAFGQAEIFNAMSSTFSV